MAERTYNCHRCQRAAPPFEPGEAYAGQTDLWEVMRHELVCPDCLTDDEKREVLIGALEGIDQMFVCLNCGQRRTEEGNPEELGWQRVGAGDRFLCPGCATASPESTQ